MKITESVISALVSKKKPLNFLHIGKTGGTSIRSLITHRSNKVFRIRERLLWRYYPIIHFHKDCRNAFQEKTNLAFFIRNPFDRFYSAFHRGKNPGNLHGDPMTPGIMELHEQFDTFQSWLEALGLNKASEMKRRAIELQVLDNNLRMDYKFYFTNKESIERKKKDIVFIGETERFDSDLDNLRTLLGAKSNKFRNVHLNKAKLVMDRKTEESRQLFQEVFPEEQSLYQELRKIKDIMSNLNRQ
jgi:hypothetical protein